MACACQHASTAKFDGLGSEIPQVNSLDAFNTTLEHATALARGPFSKVANGEQLAPQDQDDLKLAATLYRACAEFNPDKYALYMGAGQCYQALEEHGEAIKQFDEFISHIPPEFASKEEKQSAASVYVMRSQSLLQLRQFDKALASAEQANKILPYSDAEIARASALIQLGRTADAKDLLEKVLLENASDSRALKLLKLIKSENPKPKASGAKSR